MKSPFFLLLLFFLIAWSPISAQFPKIHFETNQTPDYHQLVQKYQVLDSLSIYMQLQKVGLSDAGNLIHVLVVNKNKQFNPVQTGKERNAVWLILNGIHPGESEGIDASLLFLEAMAKNPKLIPDSLTILVVPAYNVDGLINRKKYTRCGQNGPQEKGFRASANNYDLNRDFLKADSKNTLVFYQLFHQWKPELFLDTHTSNGADYQYTMTLISTQKQKLGGPAADFLYGEMNPFLYSLMKKKGFEMAPYVNVFGRSPLEKGYEVFIETPKFSTGYAALYGTLGFVAETHMLKPYPARVKATYQLLVTFLEFSRQNHRNLVHTKDRQVDWMMGLNTYASNFSVDRSNSKELLFKGFEMELRPSLLGNYQRNYFNTGKPVQKLIPYYDSCRANLNEPIPSYLVVPKQWHQVIERLKANQIMHQTYSQTDSLLVRVGYLQEQSFLTQPYEGHYTHKPFHALWKEESIQIQEGDWIIPTKQPAIRYLMEVLSPETQDGFMAWNFFDPILNEKEGYSDYVFEEEALELLQQNPKMKVAFENWKADNPEKVNDKQAVLGYLYRQSPYFEKEYLRFPVYRY